MDSLDSDLRELFAEFSECIKAFLSCKKVNVELQYKEKLLTERLNISQESEVKMRSKLQDKQNNIVQLQNILNGYLTTKEENENLKVTIKKLQEQLEEERNKYLSERDLWTSEKDAIIKTNRDDLDNMKKIKNMEVSSLNREISQLHDETQRKIELVKKEVENNYKGQLSQTIVNYEDKLTRLSRDLISAQSELRNLRQTSNDNVPVITFAETRSIKNRSIPQPLSFARYRPVAPIVSSASQMFNACDDPFEESAEKSNNEVIHQMKKKKKLYTRTDDQF